MPSMQTIAYMQADAKAHPPEPPYKVFDNLYFVGGRSVTSWAIQTSNGLILIDSMDNAQEARDYIVEGLKKLGLDPAAIKYVLVSHAHGDHYGGAEYLHDTYGARIAMSDADWTVLENQTANPAGRGNPNWGPAPKRDVVLTDGQKFTLGDATITLALTPGHTPGTMSFIIPVTDHGALHHAALWGGTGQPAAGPASDQYEASLKHFAQMTDAARVDVGISNHPLVDGTIERLTRMRADSQGPNLFVIGEQNYKRYMAIHSECLLAARERPAQRRAPAP
jgi:metallo-beta-lactamase class B